MKTYRELVTFKTFEERFEYLKLNSRIGLETFGHNRYLNQRFYTSVDWKRARRDAIARDLGCDLGIDERSISGKIYVHHIEPLKVEDILNCSDKMFDLNNLITISFDTHQAVHFGDASLLIPSQIVERRPNDTCPWRKQC